MQKIRKDNIVVREIIYFGNNNFKVNYTTEQGKPKSIKLNGRFIDFMKMLDLNIEDDLKNTKRNINLIGNSIKCKLISYSAGIFGDMLFAITDLTNEKNYLLDYGICCNKTFLEISLKNAMRQRLFRTLEHIKSSYSIPFQQEAEDLIPFQSGTESIITEIMNLEDLEI